MTSYYRLLLLCLLILLPLPSTSTAMPVRTWIYVDPTAIRWELLLPLSLAEAIAGTPTPPGQTLTVGEQEQLATKLSTLMPAINTLSIDGQPATARESRVEFFDREVTEITTGRERIPLTRDGALVGLSFEMQTASTPRRLEQQWLLFDALTQEVRCVVYTTKHTSQGVMTADSPVFRWVAPPEPLTNISTDLSLPANFRADKLSPTEAQKHCDALLRTLYESMQDREEAVLYRTLGKVVCEELLPDIYLSITRGALIEQEAGVKSRIQTIELIECKQTEGKVNDRDELRQSIKWRVSGRVEHWGHIHERINVYTANIIATRKGSTLQLCGLRVTSHERLADKRGLRGDGDFTQ